MFSMMFRAGSRSSFCSPACRSSAAPFVPYAEALIPSLVIGWIAGETDLGSFIRRIIWIFAGLALLRALNAYLSERNRGKAIDVRLRRPWAKLVHQQLTMDYEKIETAAMREKMESASHALGNNTLGYEGFLHHSVEFFSNVILLVLVSTIIGRISVWIILLLAGLSLINSLLYRRAYRFETAQFDEKGKIYARQDYFSSQATQPAVGKDVRLYQLQDWLIGRYRTLCVQLHRLNRQDIRNFETADVIRILLEGGKDLIIYGYLIRLASGGMSVSRFVLYLSMVSTFAVYFAKVVDSWNDVLRDSGLIGVFRSYNEMPMPEHAYQPLTPADFEHVEITADHVCFTYPGADRPVLQDLSFTLHAGEKLALVGVNGAGKTTIVKLLCGLYLPSSGTITYNGIPTSSIDPDLLSRIIAAVFQDSFVLSYEIWRNVTVQDKADSDLSKARQCLDMAGLKDKIDALPEGMDTYLGKDISAGGIQLSGGERQKLLMARALYKGGSLMILDEPTAQLDAIAESQMYEHFQAMTAGKSAIYISHRLASTRFCDRILFLADGRIQEQGSHEELMKQNGAYAHMFDVQSHYYNEEGEPACAAE
jgi:ATP-binding cassette subfamily B protein